MADVIACVGSGLSIQNTVSVAETKKYIPIAAAGKVLLNRQEAAVTSHFQEQLHLKERRQVLCVHTFEDLHNW